MCQPITSAQFLTEVKCNMAASVSAEKCVLTVWFYLFTLRCLYKLYLEDICNPKSLFQTRFTRMFAAVARRALQSSRNFSTSVARRGGDGLPPPGDNLPFSINNRSSFTLVYITDWLTTYQNILNPLQSWSSLGLLPGILFLSFYDLII